MTMIYETTMVNWRKCGESSRKKERKKQTLVSTSASLINVKKELAEESQDELQRERANHRRHRLSIRQRQARQPAAALCFNPPQHTHSGQWVELVLSQAVCEEKRKQEGNLSCCSQDSNLIKKLHGTTLSSPLSLAQNTQTHTRASVYTSCAALPFPA